jgi:hypothetical protein
MPKVFERDGYRFFFFSNEGDPREPVHVHVRKGGSLAKFWLEPEAQLDSAWGFSSRELNALEGMVEENRELIRRRWDEHFNR